MKTSHRRTGLGGDSGILIQDREGPHFPIAVLVHHLTPAQSDFVSVFFQLPAWEASFPDLMTKLHWAPPRKWFNQRSVIAFNAQ